MNLPPQVMAQGEAPPIVQHLQRAVTFAKSKKFEEADKEFAAAVETLPEGSSGNSELQQIATICYSGRLQCSVLLGRWKDALARLNDPRPEAKLYEPGRASEIRGKILWINGDYQSAIKELETAIKSSSGAEVWIGTNKPNQLEKSTDTKEYTKLLAKAKNALQQPEKKAALSTSFSEELKRDMAANLEAMGTLF
jgi:tetratricopeptide (TPR) repeat protein